MCQKWHTLYQWLLTLDNFNLWFSLTDDSSHDSNSEERLVCSQLTKDMSAVHARIITHRTKGW